MGTRTYFGLLVFCLVASQALLLVASWVMIVVIDEPSAMNACTVGFSGVLFALKYVLHRRSPGYTTVSTNRLSALVPGSWFESLNRFSSRNFTLFFLRKRAARDCPETHTIVICTPTSIHIFNGCAPKLSSLHAEIHACRYSTTSKSPACVLSVVCARKHAS